ncbi:MAG: ferrochelatase [Thermoguttaceae bacterium]|nr:ferrochelatase [Thermoguttaceae bacterium]
MFDALLLVSYGGPEGPDEIGPFLDRLLAGKTVPPQRREAAFRKYEFLAGKSPINDACRQFLRKLEQFREESVTEQEPCDPGVRRQPALYWGNLYAPPFLEATVEQMKQDRVQSVLIFPASVFGAIQSCRRYTDAVVKAVQTSSTGFPDLKKVPLLYDHPEYIRAAADSLLNALAWTELESLNRSPARNLVVERAVSEGRGFSEKSAAAKNFAGSDEFHPLILFAAHSLPIRDSNISQYQQQLTTHCHQILQALRLDRFPDWALVFQSRSGRPAEPWLEPSPGTFLQRYLNGHPNLKQVIVMPVGFFFENMETVYDLDVEFRALCDGLGIGYYRTGTLGTGDRVVRLVWNQLRKAPSEFGLCPSRNGSCDFSCRKSNPNPE